MDERTTWAVVTGALIVGWALVVAVTIHVVTRWSEDTRITVGGFIVGAGAALILIRRMQTRP